MTSLSADVLIMSPWLATVSPQTQIPSVAA